MARWSIWPSRDSAVPGVGVSSASCSSSQASSADRNAASSISRSVGAGRVGSWARPESWAPLLRRKVMDRVCSRQPRSVRR